MEQKNQIDNQTEINLNNKKIKINQIDNQIENQVDFNLNNNFDKNIACSIF